MSTPFFLFAQTEGSGSFLESFDGEQRFIVTIVVIVLVAIVGVILAGISAGVWSSIREKQIQADLKRDMLDRGMTAEEIQQVIEATPSTGFDRWVRSWCKKS